jgi:CheY-like chemotaxis protein
VLVDDDASFCNSFADLVQVSLSHHVEIFNSSVEFLRKLTSDEDFRNSIDLLLLDVMMSVSGETLLRQVRKYNSMWRTKVVMLSAHVPPSKDVRYTLLGANSCLEKTIDPQFLLTNLSQAL